jgi:hypothetical protein
MVWLGLRQILVQGVEGEFGKHTVPRAFCCAEFFILIGDFIVWCA